MDKIILLLTFVSITYITSDSVEGLTGRQILLDDVLQRILNHTSRNLRTQGSDIKKAINDSGSHINNNCEYENKYSIFTNYIKVSRKNPSKNMLLKKFLSIKYFQHYELISYLTIGENPRTTVEFLSILEIPTHKNIIYDKLGSKNCRLESLALSSLDKRVTVCPWHWVVISRVDRYPFELPIAQCNCNECQARTLFDLDRVRKSSCNQNYSLRPVLLRELSVDDDQEVWIFSLEKVPVSCSCSVMFNLF